MEGSRDILLNPQRSGQPLREVGGESRVSIRNDLLRQSEPSVDMLHIQFSDSFSRDRHLAGEEDGRSATAMVHNGQNGVGTSGGGKLGDKVETNHLEGEGICCCRDPELGSSFGVVLQFVLLTASATLNVRRHPAC